MKLTCSEAILMCFAFRDAVHINNIGAALNLYLDIRNRVYPLKESL